MPWGFARTPAVVHLGCILGRYSEEPLFQKSAIALNPNPVTDGCTVADFQNSSRSK